MVIAALEKKALNFHYIRLADEIESKIVEGDYKAGEKLPSIRKLHRQMGLSISTVYQAYIELEKRGAVEPREKSGFYVKPLMHHILPKPKVLRHKTVPKKVSVSDLTGSILDAMCDESVLNLGGAVPEQELLPNKQLTRLIRSIPRHELETMLLNYDRAEGNPELRRQIAKRAFGLSHGLTSDDIITTNGCLEAVSYCLRAVAKPGDTILVESPTFHGFLQLIEDLNMYALDVPTCPEEGIVMDALEKSVNKNQVRAALFIPNFQNPLGALMPEKNKERLVEFLSSKNIPIIEDDIYGDLHFGKARPTTLKYFDRKGWVLYCSSFSKTLSPGLRVGWAVPGRYRDRVKRVKLDTSIASPKFNQLVIAEFLKSGAYDRHLRKLRNAIKNQMSNMALAISKHFPDDTKITAPKGGIVLWIQLNKAVDGLNLYHEAMKRNISILPGIVCSPSSKYRNCIRVSCGHPWDDRLEKGIIKLADIINKQLNG